MAGITKDDDDLLEALMDHVHLHRDEIVHHQDWLESLTVDLIENHKYDPSKALLDGIEFLINNEPLGSQIRLRLLLEAFQNNTRPSSFAVYDELKTIVSSALAVDEPLMVLVDELSKISMKTGAYSWRNRHEECYDFWRMIFNRQSELKGLTIPMQSWPLNEMLYRAVAFIKEIQRIFWTTTSGGVYMNVVEKDGKLHYTKDYRQTEPKEFIWSDTALVQIEQKHQEAIFSTSADSDTFYFLAPLIPFILECKIVHPIEQRSELTTCRSDRQA